MQTFAKGILMTLGFPAAMVSVAMAQTFQFTPGEERTYRDLQKTSPADAEAYKISRQQIFVCRNPPGGDIISIPLLEYELKHLSADERNFIADCLRRRRVEGLLRSGTTLQPDEGGAVDQGTR